MTLPELSRTSRAKVHFSVRRYIEAAFVARWEITLRDLTHTPRPSLAPAPVIKGNDDVAVEVLAPSACTS
jgi:hypothetical protein